MLPPTGMGALAQSSGPQAGVLVRPLTNSMASSNAFLSLDCAFLVYKVRLVNE